MKPNAPIPSARAQALTLLDAVLTGRQTLDAAIAAHPLRGPEAEGKFARMLVLTVLRHLGQIDALLAQYLDKPLPAKRRSITHALRLGVAQLLLLDTPAHAAVNETVTLVKKGKDAGLSGLVNAVLQKISRAKSALPAAALNVPGWLAKRWNAAYGAEALAAMAHVAATRPPLDLQRGLGIRDSGLGEIRLDTRTVRLPADHAPVETLPGYTDGAFFVQDIAASYPVRLLGDVAGLRVLDVCAAPGGKAMQLALGGAQVTALDRSASRMKRVVANAARVRCALETVVADALEWTPPALYDAILLDAPCSATGTWRRHPEVVHLVTPEQIAELVALQRALLTRAWGWLKPGGKLVYCVCSLEREEGESQADWFGGLHPQACVVPVDAATMEIPAACITAAGHLRTLPSHLAEQGGMDGFFAAAWVKKAD